MTSRKERAEKTGKESFLEQAAAYYDDMKKDRYFEEGRRRGSV